MHGVELDSETRQAWMHHGFLRLSGVLSLIGLGLEKPAAASASFARFRNRRFQQLTERLRALFWKFERSAEHVELCRAEIARHAERDRDRSTDNSLSLDDIGRFQAVTTDLPLFLDLMLLYLRMKADTLAGIVTYMYPRGGMIPTHSFREQRDWFLRTRPNFDCTYATILTDRTNWFEALAGKSPTGLRDAIVHGSATNQLAWSIGDEPQSEIRVFPSLIDHQGVLADNLIAEIREITIGWCSFLDATHVHFMGRLVEDGILSLGGGQQTRLYTSERRENPNFWVYPKCHREPNTEAAG